MSDVYNNTSTQGEYKEKIKNLLKKDRVQLVSYASLPKHEVRMREEIENRREELKNVSLQQDIELKKKTLFLLFRFLAAETCIIFLFSFFQAVQLFGFQLEEWSFKLLVSATIAQITVMLMVAVKHLFPHKEDNEPT
ncbi:MAG TPA: hypothetical protein VEA18_02275 [Candidatus Kapabacteria bacterium]|nr:hypothetical protein [Candidatus Kapabacteria bacterium]